MPVEIPDHPFDLPQHFDGTIVFRHDISREEAADWIALEAPAATPEALREGFVTFGEQWLYCDTEAEIPEEEREFSVRVWSFRPSTTPPTSGGACP